ncbi:MAG: response regulator transcription factor [Anaerolineae bacterium]
MSNKRLLIIDPDPALPTTLKLYFENAGYKVNLTADESKGILAARSWQPGAILISSQLAGEPAHQVCQNLLRHSLTGHIPIILLLALNDRQARLKALELGVDDVIHRPIDVEELKLRVEAAIRLASFHRAA